MPPKASAPSSSTLPSKVEDGINTVGRGAKRVVDGTVSLTGRVIGYMEGPVAALALVIIVFLGLWGIYKLFKQWDCRPGNGTTAYSAAKTIAHHSAVLKKKGADGIQADAQTEHDDNKQSDARCVLAFAHLRAVSGAIAGAQPVANLYDANADDVVKVGTSLRDVRVWCQPSTLKDKKLNACDAIKAWKAECEMAPLVPDAKGAGPKITAGQTFLNQVIADGKDKKKKDTGVGINMTGEPTVFNPELDTARMNKIRDTTDGKEFVAAAVANASVTACQLPTSSSDIHKAAEC